MFKKALSWITTESVLELGCGVGQFAHLLNDERQVKYKGVDFSEVAIERCKKLKLKGYEFEQADIYELEYINDSDVIVALETLEHLDDLRVLDRIEKGKKLIISLPTFNNEAHLIWFDDAKKIIDRYESTIKIMEIIKISDWFLFYGYKL